MISLNTYFLLSLILTVVAIINAYTIHEQFYTTVIYVTTTKVNKTILMNLAFSVLLLLMNGSLWMFIGEIREIEKLNIVEKLKRKMLDFALMLIIFREDTLDGEFFALLVSLMAVSILHWMAIKRSEYYVSESQGTVRQHLKLLFFFLLLNVIDFMILEKYFTLYRSKKQMSHVSILFAVEFFLIFTKGLLPFVKYCVNLFEIITYSHFESKMTMFSVLDFFFTTTKLIIELCFFNYIRQNMGFPIHLIGETIENIISLANTFKNFYNSCILTYRFNRLPNITDADLSEAESTCLICLHEIKIGKKISCGHVFHLGCLKTWIQGNINQFCPKCKAPIKIDTKFKIPANQLRLNENNAIPEQNQNNQKVDDPNSLEGLGASANINNSKIVEDVTSINKIISEIELLESITSYDQFKQSKDVLFNDKNLTEETNLLEKNFRKEIFNFDAMDEINFHRIGSFQFGLPRPAVSYRSWEIESYRKKIELLNILWGKYFLHSESITDKFPLKLIPLGQENEAEEIPRGGGQMGSAEKYRSSDYLDNIEFSRPANIRMNMNKNLVRSESEKYTVNSSAQNNIPNNQRKTEESQLNQAPVTSIPSLKESQSVNLDNPEVRRRHIVEAMQKRLSAQETTEEDKKND